MEYTNQILTESKEMKVGNSLPQIPKSFIEYFINEYNNGRVVSKVLVEVKEYCINNIPKQDHTCVNKDHKIKLNESNEVSILNVSNKLDYYRNNAEENYITTPISVLRYISELEKYIEQNLNHTS